MADIYDRVLQQDLNMKIEDVWKVVTLAQADRNPLIGLIQPRRKVSTQTFSQPVDAHNFPKLTAYYDGERQTVMHGTVSEQIFGQTQEMRQPWAIGRQAQAEKTYPGDELVSNIKKKALAFLSDQVEAAASSTQTLQTQTAAARPKMRGAFEITDAVGGAFMGATLPIPDKFRSVTTYHGALSDFTSATLQQML